MKRLRRSSHCLNCGFQFAEPSDSFCPKCGQANTDNRVSLQELWRDLFENYISLDSRMGHTIIPFLFHPARLTREFSRGRRIHYVHPVKLYLLSSVLFFFAFSKLVMPDFNQELNNWQLRLEQSSSDTTSLPPESTENGIIEINYGDADSAATPDTGLTRFYRLASRRDLEAAAFADSVHFTEDTPTSFELFAAGQIQKIFRNDVALFISSIIQNTPLVVLVVLPLLAFLLQLFYWRRFYVEHLVLALHWQSFTYVLLIMGMIAYKFGLPLSGVVAVLTFLLSVYSFLLLLRFYRQHWFWTLLKLGFIGAFYISALTFAVSLNAVISVFLF